MMEIKNITDFELYVVNRIIDVLGDDFKDAVVEIEDVVKQNDEVLRAMVIKRVGERVAPTIYLNSYYEAYEKGKDLDDILQHMAAFRRLHSDDCKVEDGFVKSWDYVKDKVIPKVINRDMNERYLRNKPYSEIEDLAVVYYVLLDEYKTEDGMMSVCITDELFRSWDIGFKELQERAVKNMRRILPASMRGLGMVLGDLLGADFPSDLLESGLDDTIYVLTNRTAVNGAMVVTDREFMDGVHQKLGRDFYAIPCSVHEWLCIPVMDAQNISELISMIRSVNDTELQKRDLLSYNLYRYNPETGLKIVNAADKQLTA